MENSKIYAIGDVHGELDKLKNLFEKISVRPNDTIVFLGDYIDRGPDSKGVINFIIDLKSRHNVITLKGNHEQFAIDSIKNLNRTPAWGENPFPLRSWLRNGGYATFDSYKQNVFSEMQVVEEIGRVHSKFLQELQLTYETDTHIFVHGYLSHELDVEDQEEWLCLWSRYNDILPHKSGKIVVCGHTIQPDVKDNGFKVCIDTGSFKPNGFITAMVIEEDCVKYIDSR